MGRPAIPYLRRAPNRKQLWANLLIEELVRCGVGLFCLAPGSRSTPLVAAIAAHPTSPHLIHFDERGAAFAALGWARATGRPAAVVTTSGTAVANLLPAVVEASVDGVPLVLLTADRPPELRDTGANQTIPQSEIFGDLVRWHFDVPVPTETIDPAFILTTADQAVYRATASPSGPVHINCMFREPLAPDGPGVTLDGLDAWLDGDVPYTRYMTARAVDDDAVQAVTIRLANAARGLVVAGRLATRREGEAAARLAEALGWPLLPDIGSQARLSASPVACPFYDYVLGNAAFREAHAPDLVLHLGGRSTSKRLAQFLDEAQPERIVVRDDPFRFDPEHRVAVRVVAEVGGFCETLVPRAQAGHAPSDWLHAWRRASEAVVEALGSDIGGLSEPSVARRVAATAKGGLVLAASMPVRDADTFAGASVTALVASNRGASGIDGTVATAAGFARGLKAPITLLLGDLALLHDLNSLALLRDGPPVTVVAINNDGGGIFHFLPIAAHDAIFEPYFGTPHGLGFEDAARMFGLAYHQPKTADDFDAALAEAQASGTSALIEVRTEREANRTLHADLLRRAAEAVEATLANVTE